VTAAFGGIAARVYQIGGSAIGSLIGRVCGHRWWAVSRCDAVAGRRTSGRPTRRAGRSVSTPRSRTSPTLGALDDALSSGRVAAGPVVAALG
jgi:hypothetical protein